MAKEKFKRKINPGEIKPGKCIYGIDEIGLIFAHYGKDSEIYKEMASGQVVSNMIEESIKKELKEIENKKRLLKMCQTREKIVEESQTQSIN